LGYSFILDFPQYCSCCSFSEYFSHHSCPLPSVCSFLRPNLMPQSQGTCNMPLYNSKSTLVYYCWSCWRCIFCVLYLSW